MKRAKISAAVLTGLLLLTASSGAMAADPRNGAKLYNIHCSGCHGTRGRGVMPGTPDFSRGILKPNAVLVEILEQGSGVMPAFRGILSTQDMLDVIAHLRTFQ
jgi:cytochrome c6